MTLIELLVAIAVVAILIAIIVPACFSSIQKARQSTCLNNLHQIGLAISQYSTDYDDLYPAGCDAVDKHTNLWKSAQNGAYWTRIQQMPMLQDVLAPYIRDRHVWECPSDTGYDVVDNFTDISLLAHPTAFSAFGTSYSYRTSLGLHNISLSRIAGTMPDGTQVGPSDINVLWDTSGKWHGGREAVEGRYNVLMGDGRVVFMTRSQITNAWNIDVVPPPPPPSN